MEFILKKWFGYSSFRPYQKEIVKKILEGRDCLVVMATGSGKSLCYQVPPLASQKTAVIISPLLSLMQDQVMALKQRGIKAEHLSSAQTDSSAYRNSEKGYFDILYMTPEKACSLSRSFWSNLLNIGICLVAVDEAHCISEWGHNFRVEYKQLDKLRDILLNVPFVGLTATATEKVRSDISNSLKMKDPYVTIGSFDRNNLFYGVKPFYRGQSFVEELVGEVSKHVAHASSTIIYCTTIKDVELVSKSLQEAGVKAGIYHGQMSNKAREESHRSFIRDEFYVMVATIAFGMGIDKPNIRYVIHYGCPKSLESYYQESGRCGRDGSASACWLYYTSSDFAKADFYCGEAHSADQRRAILESFRVAQRYCMLTTCRRKFLLEYLGERITVDKCGNCDNCSSSKRESDMSRQAFLLMACIQACGGNWGLNMPVDVLRGSRAKKIIGSQFDKLPFHGLGKELSANWWKALANQLVSYGYLTEVFHDVYKTVSVSPKGMQFLNSCRPDYQPPLFLPLTDQMIMNEENKTLDEVQETNGMAPLEYEGLSKAETQLYKMLLEERMKLARVAGTAPYAICGDQTLKRVALARPTTKARLAIIDGVNQHLVALHGNHFLKIIQSLSQELNLLMDGDANMLSTITKKVHTLPDTEKKLSPAKLEAWRMWQEDGLSIQKIANNPARSAPIKDQTVCGYLLDAAREGYAIDWTRLCKEIGLTQEVLANIQVAISKVGSKDRMKPIKNELPEEITYMHITACLTMQDMGTSEVILPSNQLTCQAEEHFDETSKPSQKSNLPCSVEGHHQFERPVDDFGFTSDNTKEIMSVPPVIETKQNLNYADDIISPRKRKKFDSPEKQISLSQEATESSVLNWLKNFHDGVPLNDIVKHFKGSKEEQVVNLLNCLEGEFLIFKKNDLYQLM